MLTPPTPPDTIDVAKSNFANSDGSISTAAAENVRANSHVDGVPFVEWKKIVPAPSIQSNPDVRLAQNESGEIWFAFYQTPKSTVALPEIVQLISAGIFVWTGDDTCGNSGHWVGPGHGPGPGPTPFKIAVSKKVMRSLSPAQREKLETFATDYPAIAQSSLIAMTKTLSVLLQGVSKILASAQE